MLSLTRLRLKTSHPRGLILSRCERYIGITYSIQIQEEDTAVFAMLRDVGIIDHMFLPTEKGMLWIETTLQEFGGRPIETLDTKT